MLSPPARKRLRRRAARILSASGLTEAEWSILLTDDDEVARLNAEFLGVTTTTDVLSFPMQEGPGAALHPQLLGDVAISVEQAGRQARRGRERQRMLEREIVRLLVHGLCHLRGMDHRRSRDAKKMEAEEARMLEAVT